MPARKLADELSAKVSMDSSSDGPLPPRKKEARPYGLSTITWKWYEYLRSDIGGKVAKRHADQYARRVERFLVFTSTHDCPQKAMNPKDIQRFNAHVEKGHSWRKNTYHFLIKFAVYLLFAE